MAKARKKRHRYTEAKRGEILAAAQKDGLTAAQVQTKFGVTPVTYYSWRKKAKMPAMPRGRRPGSGKRGGRALSSGAETQLRSQVRRRVQEIVQDEVQRALRELA